MVNQLSYNFSMNYCVFIKGGDILEIEELEKMHDEVKNREDNFSDLLQLFIDSNRQNAQLVNRPYIENLVSNLGQITYSFSEFKKAKAHLPDEKNKEENYYYNIETASMLVFFFNAKSFLEIVSKYTNFPKDKIFFQLLEDITTLRNHFAHAYEKDTYMQAYPKAFVTNIIQRGLDIESVELIELQTGIRLGTLFFSLHIFYFLLKDIFEQLTSDLTFFDK